MGVVIWSSTRSSGSDARSSARSQRSMFAVASRACAALSVALTALMRSYVDWKSMLYGSGALRKFLKTAEANWWYVQTDLKRSVRRTYRA